MFDRFLGQGREVLLLVLIDVFAAPSQAQPGAGGNGQFVAEIDGAVILIADLPPGRIAK